MLAATVDRHGWAVHAYCLMDNHYHLLLHTPEANLAAGMQQLNANHAQRFNRLRNRPGHLFQGRYASSLVDSEAHLIQSARYIALNPVRAGLCPTPERWRWSSYRATIGLDPGPEVLDPSTLLGPFGSPDDRARRGFQAFVEDAMTAVVGGLRNVKGSDPEP